MSLLCVVDLVAYLVGYFVRLRLMAKLGKSDVPAVRRRYFVEEQMVATPVAVGLLSVLAAIGPVSIHVPLREGFFDMWTDTTAAWAVLAGVCSQGTGVFGGLLLLDGSETTYCVPLNRASSILGGVVAAVLLAVMFGIAPPSGGELAGAVLLLLAIGVLWLGPRLRRHGEAARPASRSINNGQHDVADRRASMRASTSSRIA
jgi:hypothetical protein